MPAPALVLDAGLSPAVLLLHIPMVQSYLVAGASAAAACRELAQAGRRQRHSELGSSKRAGSMHSTGSMLAQRPDKGSLHLSASHCLTGIEDDEGQAEELTDSG